MMNNEVINNPKNVKDMELSLVRQEREVLQRLVRCPTVSRASAESSR